MIPRTPARPLSERTLSLEWSHALIRAWLVCRSAHDTFGELLALTDELGDAAPDELHRLTRVAHTHWLDCERWASPIYAAYARQHALPDVAG